VKTADAWPGNATPTTARVRPRRPNPSRIKEMATTSTSPSMYSVPGAATSAASVGDSGGEEGNRGSVGAAGSDPPVAP
jgi:hypothetical protein